MDNRSRFQTFERCRRFRAALLVLACSSALAVRASAQEPQPPDTSMVFHSSRPELVTADLYQPLEHSWGLDLMLSTNGFGLGGFYRRQVTDVLAGTLSLGISDVKDEGEIEYVTYYGQSIVPGKKNRLVMLPLLASIQYRLFKDDIVDNFRPYLTAGAGPTMLYVSPYSRITNVADGTGGTYQQSEKVDFFESLKWGKAHYTLGSFIGAGAYFGKDKVSVLGLSVRYYFVPVRKGIEVMSGGYVREFGGLYITIHFGSAS